MNRMSFHSRILEKLAPTTMDRYLLRQVVPPFSIALGVVMAALLLERLLVLFNLLAANGSSMKTFFALLSDLIPHYLGLALPAAMCVSVFSVIRRMSANHEIDALMASGVSIFRICQPFVLTGAIFGFLAFSLYGFIQPYARYDYRSAFYFASHAGWTPHLQSKMFALSDDIVLTAENVDHAGSRMWNVFIRDGTDKAHVRFISAQKGYLFNPADGSNIRLDLVDGTVITDSQDKPPTITSFSRTTRMISTKGKLDTEAYRKRGETERELTVPELYYGIRYGNPTISHSYMIAELNFRLARTAAIPFIPILACALAGVRKRQKNNPGLAIAAITLVGFDHTLQMGMSFVANMHMSPLLVIWLPTLVFSLICVGVLIRQAGGLRILLEQGPALPPRQLSADGLPRRMMEHQA
ncbi:putative permease [Gluconacetobacter sp. SXCC-1]|nr:putative permease [Gluconacetobacter sp. SXCC-1]KDU97235.1 transporter [Komagataeibacter rhaeticus AF1]SAY48104.1 putative permease YjgP/YjgQ family protein [Komagataeibacter rhaeticus]